MLPREAADRTAALLVAVVQATLRRLAGADIRAAGNGCSWLWCATVLASARRPRSSAFAAICARLHDAVLVASVRSQRLARSLDEIELRIARAAHLLQTTDKNITETAFECGFEDSNYFSRQFRKIMGITPRLYKTQQATGKTS